MKVLHIFLSAFALFINKVKVSVSYLFPLTLALISDLLPRTVTVVYYVARLLEAVFLAARQYGGENLLRACAENIRLSQM